jgi:hypothetical protein
VLVQGSLSPLSSGHGDLFSTLKVPAGETDQSPQSCSDVQNPF